MNHETKSLGLLDGQTVIEDRIATVEDYFDSWDDKDISEADYVSSQLDGPPLPDTVVIIPVAAHVEASNIYRTLVEYARQEGCGPFAVHLHLNYPADLQDMSGVDQTLSVLARAKKDFPDLDFRLTGASYLDTTIGHIRRVAWNATLHKLYEENEGLPTAIGLNHDADLMRLGSHYIANVQEYYRRIEDVEYKRAYLPAASTETKHFPSPDHPNTTRAVYWSDYTARVQRIGYEAGLVIPFVTYAQKNGFQKEDITHESSAFHDGGRLTFPMIPGTRLETSMRRHLDRLSDHGYGGVWTHDSFGSNDPCREEGRHHADMSELRLHEIVRENAPEFAQAFMRRLFGYGLTRDQRKAIRSEDQEQTDSVAEELGRKAARVSRMTSFVLDAVVKVDGVGDHLAEHYFDEASIRYRIGTARYRLLESDRVLDDLISQLDGVPAKSAWQQLQQLRKGL